MAAAKKSPVQGVLITGGVLVVGYVVYKWLKSPKSAQAASYPGSYGAGSNGYGYGYPYQQQSQNPLSQAAQALKNALSGGSGSGSSSAQQKAQQQAMMGVPSNSLVSSLANILGIAATTGYQSDPSLGGDSLNTANVTSLADLSTGAADYQIPYEDSNQQLDLSQWGTPVDSGANYGGYDNQDNSSGGYADVYNGGNGLDGVSIDDSGD